MLGDKSIYKEPWFYIMLFVLIATGIIGGFLLYRAMNKPAEVQGTSQTIAETQQGVKIAANKAGYRLDDGQAKEISGIQATGHQDVTVISVAFTSLCRVERLNIHSGVNHMYFFNMVAICRAMRTGTALPICMYVLR